MPTYSVTMFLPKPERPGWTKMQMLIKASNPRAASKRAFNRFNHSVLRVHEIKPDREREKWRRIWQRAYNNMPVFLRTDSIDHWHTRQKPMNVGEYIKLEAKGRIRKVGKYEQINHPQQKTWRTNRIKMLSRCLNYPQATRIGMFVSVRNGLVRGTVPANAVKQEVLKHLAGPNGQLIALKLLNGEHLYDPEPTPQYNPDNEWGYAG